MPEDRLEKLGNYFVHFNILESYGITFKRFLELVEADIWREYVA